MITIAVCAREYPSNSSNNIFGDDCALISLAVRVPHPVYPDKIVEAMTWMLISSVGKPPKILSEEDALRARANTFYGKKGFCSAIESSLP